MFFFVPYQRQKLRDIILQQQQKKNAVRQEKVPQESAMTPHVGPGQQWHHENMNQLFTRPPPPYPGNVRSAIVPPRFTGFPVDGQFTRSQFPREMGGMGVRAHGIRYISCLFSPKM